MKKKFALLLVVTFVLSIFTFGCQNTAQRPLNPNQNNVTRKPNVTTPNTTTTTTLTDSEARAMAKKLADMADKVKGVDDAYVVVSEINTMGTNNVGSNRTNMGTTNTGMTDNVGTPGNGGLPGVTGNTRTNNGITGNNITNNTNMNTNNMNTNNMTTNTNNARGIVVMVGLDLDDNYMNNATNMDRVQREVANKIKASDNRISQVYVTTDENMVDRIEDVADDIVNGRTVSALRSDINNIFRDLTAKGPAF